ncbi:MAG: hypothetical protein ACR2O1_15850 [Boseongicola sp.]
MGMLHLAPAMLLGSVAIWLLWPIIVEPSLRKMKSLRRPKAESADKLADAMFGTWSRHGTTPGLVKPLH